MDWKIRYAPGAPYVTFSSEDGTWEEAYGELVITVTVREKKEILDEGWTRRMLNQRDYYAYTAGDLYPIVTNDPIPLLIRWGIEVPCPFPKPPEFREFLKAHGVRERVKFAALVSDEIWQAGVIAASNDTDFAVGTTPGRREGDWSR